MPLSKDRFGMGWRTELAAGILSNLDRIDVVEVIADDYFDASSRDVRALRTLSRQTPVMLHAVGLGMASTLAVDSRRVQKLARLVHAVEPECWSEHLAFVRGGGVEIGHLAAPPRNRFSIEGTLTNIDRATRCIGARPLVENIATLIDPPGSTMDEAGWLSALLEDTQAHLLLDLHNVHTNATNFGFDARVFVDALPLHRIGAIHIAGGRPMGRRVLDDHRHDVPDRVYDLLAHVASRVSEPLTVILERDGAYPSMGDLLAQLDQARAAVARGRAEVGAKPLQREITRISRPDDGAFSMEPFLSRLYADPRARARFLADPLTEARNSGLSDEQAKAVVVIDAEELTVAGRSFDYKRGH